MLEVSFHGDPEVRGSLFLDTQRMRSVTRAKPSAIAFSHRSSNTPARRSAESFIENAYDRCYGSAITQHYPLLISLHGADGNVVAAVGVRAAAREPLFLEQYLKMPIQDALLARAGVTVAREKIVEIGNLASEANGASIFLFVTLAAYLKQQRFAYAAVTATDLLRQAFAFFSFDPTPLGAANPQALPDGGTSWGRYYGRDPQILAGAISVCFSRLERFLPPENNAGLDGLFSRISLPMKESLP